MRPAPPASLDPSSVAHAAAAANAANAPLLPAADAPVEGYQLAQLVRDLRSYQAELESQNKVLRYSQAVAEGASERFETLFSSVPLALMVVDEHDMVVQSNSMAQRLFQPTERDRPLNFLMPFVSAGCTEQVRQAFREAHADGHCEATEVVFSIGEDGTITGDLHIARLENAHEPTVHYICAVIDQGPLRTLGHDMPTADAVRGRGLAIVERICDDVTVSATPEGTRVRLRLRL